MKPSYVLENRPKTTIFVLYLPVASQIQFKLLQTVNTLKVYICVKTDLNQRFFVYIIVALQIVLAATRCKVLEWYI